MPWLQGTTYARRDQAAGLEFVKDSAADGGRFVNLMFRRWEFDAAQCRVGSLLGGAQDVVGVSVKRPWAQSPRLSQVIDKATRPCMALRTAPGFFTDRRGSGQGAEVVLDTVPVRMRAHDKN